MCCNKSTELHKNQINLTCTGTTLEKPRNTSEIRNQTTLYGILRNSTEFNANSVRSSEVPGPYLKKKILAEFRIEGIL